MRGKRMNIASVNLQNGKQSFNGFIRVNRWYPHDITNLFNTGCMYFDSEQGQYFLNSGDERKNYIALGYNKEGFEKVEKIVAAAAEADRTGRIIDINI